MSESLLLIFSPSSSISTVIRGRNACEESAMVSFDILSASSAMTKEAKAIIKDIRSVATDISNFDPIGGMKIVVYNAGNVSFSVSGVSLQIS